jgi:hypothetical protein
LLVASALHQDVEDVVVLVNGAPQIMARTLDGQKHLVQVPLVPGLGAPALRPIGVVLSKLPTPLADGFVGHGDTASEEEFLHIAVTQGEAIVEPDTMADDVDGEAVVLIVHGAGRRGHIGLPILGFV